MSSSVLVRVQSIRSQNPYGRGGCIFIGTEINEVGDVIDASSYLVIKATGAQLGEGLVKSGQWWRVAGESKSYEREINGFRVQERQIVVTEISLMRVSGKHIITLMAASDDFQGIGVVKARKLWETFGERLYQILEDADIDVLATVLSIDSARQVIKAWSLQGNARVLQWLQSGGISRKIGQKLLAYFGTEVEQKLSEDPYRLLSFSASWKDVDAFAS